MTLNDITPNIFVINLLRRTDRLEHIQEQSRRFDFDAMITAAVDAQEINNPTNLRPGEYALLLSHGKILTYARYMNLDKIIVLEDDADFVADTNERLSKEWQEIPSDFDLVYLGCNKQYLGAGRVPATDVSDNIIRLYSAFTTHAMVINSSIYDIVLDKIDQFNMPLDVIYSEVQKDCKAYGFKKNLAKQLDCHSDIIGFNPAYQAQGVYD